MCAKDKSMDGMVGQVQNCLFFQTPSVIKCGISLDDVSHGGNVNPE
jgi:hypothetical protein